MKILIAEDEPISRLALERLLGRWGHRVVSCRNGVDAVLAFRSEDPPRLAILDWMMPEKDGLEVCREIRQMPECGSTYVIMLTAKDSKEDLVEGFQAGADDYVVKPFDREELRVRLGAGIRIAENESIVRQRIKHMESVSSQMDQLRQLLPVCAHCRRARNDEKHIMQAREYLSMHEDEADSYWVCLSCAPEVHQEAMDDQIEDVYSSADLVAASRHKSDFRGDLTILSVSEVIQTIHRAMKTGALCIRRHDGGSGEIFFVDGDARHARTDLHDGEEAFYELQSWWDGEFEFNSGESVGEESIYRPVLALLVEGMRRMDDESPESP